MTPNRNVHLLAWQTDFFFQNVGSKKLEYGCSLTEMIILIVFWNSFEQTNECSLKWKKITVRMETQLYLKGPVLN